MEASFTTFLLNFLFDAFYSLMGIKKNNYLIFSGKRARPICFSVALSVPLQTIGDRRHGCICSETNVAQSPSSKTARAANHMRGCAWEAPISWDEFVAQGSQTTRFSNSSVNNSGAAAYDSRASIINDPKIAAKHLPCFFLSFLRHAPLNAYRNRSIIQIK